MFRLRANSKQRSPSVCVASINGYADHIQSAGYTGQMTNDVAPYDVIAYVADWWFNFTINYPLSEAYDACVFAFVVRCCRPLVYISAAATLITTWRDSKPFASAQT